MGRKEAPSGPDPAPVREREIPFAFKKLVVVRHGEGEGDGLSAAGKEQVKTLGFKIKEMIDQENLSYRILSSSVGRAKQTSEHLAKIIKCSVEEHEALSFSPGSIVDDLGVNDLGADDPRVQEIVKLISFREAGMLILVTHSEYCLSVAEAVGNRLGQKLPLRPFSTGQGFMIDTILKQGGFI